MLGLFVLLGGLLFSSTAHAEYQKFLPGSDIYIGEFVFDDDFQATTTANCTLTVYDPSGVLVVNAASMTADANSFYSYSFTPSENQGVWPAYMTCGSALNGSLIRGDKTFEITDNIVSSSSVATLVNANTNTTINTASSSLSATLPNSIWSFSGRTLTSFGTLVADIWANGTRTLTGFGTLASDVWAVATRTLTAATLSSGSLATVSDITTASTSIAASVNNVTNTASTSIAAVVNGNTNTRIDNASTSIVASVNNVTNTASTSISASVNNVTNTASTSLAASIGAVPVAVWNVATSTMTTVGSIGRVLATNIDVVLSTVGGGSLTAADIWTYGTRTLTGAGLSSGSLAVQSDVTTASTSLGAAITNSQTAINANTDTLVGNASTSIAASVNTNTNSIVQTASTSLGVSLTSIAASITSIPANVWAAGTRTLTGFGTLAADVWTNGTRTLTGAELSSGSLATQTDVQTASSSVVALVNATTNSASTSIAASVNNVTNTASTSIAASVNTNTNSASTSLGVSLTSIASSITSIPANVWAAGTRTLTSFGTIASDVWSNGTRTLTGASLSSGSLATQTDVQTASSSVVALVNANTNTASTSIAASVNNVTIAASTSIAASVNNVTTAASTSVAASVNNVTNTASTSLGVSLASLPAAIWNVATSTMSIPGTVGNVIAVNLDRTISSIVASGGSLTAADVWSFGTRTLTGAGLSSGSLATQTDLTTASTSIAASVNNNTDTRVGNASTSIAASVNNVTGAASTSIAASVNNNTNAAVLTASTSLASSISSIPAAVWNVATSTLSTTGSIGRLIVANLDAVVSTIGGGSLTVADIWSYGARTLTGASLTTGSLATLSDIENATSSVAAVVATRASLTNQQAGWTVRQSDFGSVLGGETYRTRVHILNYLSAPATPFATPTVTVYDSARNVVVSSVAMTALGTGVYEYTYSVPSLAAAGEWEAVVSTQVESGKTIQTNDYFEVAGAPAQVLIQSMGSLVIPTITANVRITNEGTADYEYQYEWCVVSNINNACGGGNDTYYASAAKLINAGDDFDTVLSATVPTEGEYYFKTVAYFGTDSSGASRQFTTSNYVPTSGGGGGGGGGGGDDDEEDANFPQPKGASDVNGDGKVSAVDFSIMLAYWKTSGPFANPYVDLNKDGRVDAVDFSILLYHWGKRY